ncbi:MAG: hypothetical protein Q6373_007540 [Candidatus Sigynarchaeota archaeon]
MVEIIHVPDEIANHEEVDRIREIEIRVHVPEPPIEARPPFLEWQSQMPRYDKVEQAWIIHPSITLLSQADRHAYLEADFDRITGISLNFASLGIKSLSQISGLDTFDRLDTLYLDDNPIRDISELLKFPWINTLTNLFATNMQLTSIPDLSSLQNLERLYLVGNPLVTIPDMTPLKKLHTLTLPASTFIEEKTKTHVQRNMEIWSREQEILRSQNPDW